MVAAAAFTVVGRRAALEYAARRTTSGAAATGEVSPPRDVPDCALVAPSRQAPGDRPRLRRQCRRGPAQCARQAPDDLPDARLCRTAHRPPHLRVSTDWPASGSEGVPRMVIAA